MDPFSLIIMGALMLVNFLLQPKPKAADLSQINLPTAVEDRPVPVIWGTVRLESPNLLWYGNYKTSKIKKFFGLVTAGFKYSVGMQLAFCHGPGVRLEKIWAGEKEAWSGSVGGPAAESASFNVDMPNLFGGTKLEGGLAAKCTFYSGTGTQPVDSYLQGQLGQLPAYRNLSYLVWKGAAAGKVGSYDSGYFGTTGNLRPFSFQLSRFPGEMLSLTYTKMDGFDTRLPNPGRIVEEILMDLDWGLGVAETELDGTSFADVCGKLYTEHFGMCAIWDTQQPVKEVLDGILTLIGGVLYSDPATGRYVLNLIREETEEPPLYDDSNVDAVIDYQRATYSETPNELRTSFTDMDQMFRARTILVQDLANLEIQGGVPVAIEARHVGLADATNAARVGARDLRALSYPLAAVKLRLFRGEASRLRPGSLIRWTCPELNITEMFLRVIGLDYGQFNDGFIKVDATQDVFNLGDTLFAPVGSSGDPADEAPPIADPVAVNPTIKNLSETPFAISHDPGTHVWAFAAQPNISQLAVNLYVDPELDGTYVSSVQGEDFTPTGVLVNDYLRTTAAIDSGDLEIDTGIELAELVAAVPTQVQQGANYFLITNGTTEEWCAFTDVTLGGGGTSVVLSGIYRGLFDTVPQNHAAGARVWFASYGSVQDESNYDPDSTLNAKLTSSTAQGEGTVASATVVSTVIKQRALRPLPPGNFKVNTVYNPTTIPATGDVVISWLPRNRLDTRVAVAQDADASPLGAELNTIYTLKIYGAVGTGTLVLIRTQPLTATDTSYTYDNATETADAGALQDWLMFVLSSERDGLNSWQAQRWTVKRPSGGSTPPTPPAPPTPGGTYVPTVPGTTLISAESLLLGRGEGAGGGPVEEIELGPNLVMTGTTLDAVPAVPILAASRLLGRGSAAGSGSAQAITLGPNLSMTGTALDAVIPAPSVPPEFNYKAPVRVATRGSLPTYTHTAGVLTATANGALPAQDGLTLVVGNRLLVKDEVINAKYNGIYTVTQVGDATHPFILTRSTDADSSAKVTANLMVPVEEGTANADTMWWLTTNNPITLDTTALTFSQFVGGGGASNLTVEQYITDAYQGSLDRDPTGIELSDAADDLTDGCFSNTILTQTLALQTALFTDAAYLAKATTDAEYIEDLYRAFLGRGADSIGLTFWENFLSTGGTRSSLLSLFNSSTEHTNRRLVPWCTQMLPRASAVEIYNVPIPGGYAQRTDYVYTTASLANLADEVGLKAIAKSAELVRIDADRACRVRLYSTAAKRDADRARAEGASRTAEDGLLGEFVFTALLLTVPTHDPVVLLYNNDTVVVDSIYITVQNKSGSTSTVAVTMKAVGIEI